MADLIYPIAMIDGVPVVDAPQAIDAANAEWFRTILLHAAFRGHGTVVVNMTGTQFCDSSGVGVLVWAHEQAVAQAGEVLLVTTADTPVRRAFELTGTDFLIPSFADLTKALQQARTVLPRP
jgi:anti-sigma B factor antagonist